MDKKSININRMLYLIDKQGLTQTEAAKRLGVTRQAVSQKLKEVRPSQTKVVAVKKIEQAVNNKMDSIEQLKKINDKANELLDEVEDNPAMAVKIMGEIRQQLALQLQIFSVLYDLKAAEDFQNTILEVIGKINPDARREIISKLNSTRAIRQAVRFS